MTDLSVCGNISEEMDNVDVGVQVKRKGPDRTESKQFVTYLAVRRISLEYHIFGEKMLGRKPS
jgi:hypothetical protein